jgi:hypothetical protein
MREDFNRSTPVEDIPRRRPDRRGSRPNWPASLTPRQAPDDYAHRLIELLCPVTLPYELDTAATFGVAGFNGRSLADDVMDVFLILATNTQLIDEVAPDGSRMRDEFPYFGEAFARTEPS